MKKSFDKIIAVFDRTIVDLKKLVEQNDRVISVNVASISELKRENDALLSENERAGKIIGNIADLIDKA